MAAGFNFNGDCCDAFEAEGFRFRVRGGNPGTRADWLFLLLLNVGFAVGVVADDTVSDSDSDSDPDTDSDSDLASESFEGAFMDSAFVVFFTPRMFGFDFGPRAAVFRARVGGGNPGTKLPGL